ncbi:MAG: transposase [Bacteroidetes bacterium GWA2_31_9]|nr:MAG: transposase [Bacteroidetes bacterium GWA2_31_9]
MPYIKIWIHAVWSTYNREPFLNEEVRPKVFEHIKDNAKSKGIYLDEINGYSDHVHCTISMNAEQNIATIMNLLKGESSYWINKNKLINFNFGWQDEYFAVSVSTSQIDIVRQYIRNQVEHHSKITFQQEYEDFIKKYNFEI